MLPTRRIKVHDLVFKQTPDGRRTEPNDRTSSHEVDVQENNCPKFTISNSKFLRYTEAVAITKYCDIFFIVSFKSCMIDNQIEAGIGITQENLGTC